MSKPWGKCRNSGIWPGRKAPSCFKDPKKDLITDNTDSMGQIETHWVQIVTQCAKIVTQWAKIVTQWAKIL